jgi:hypothetical protein
MGLPTYDRCVQLRLFRNIDDLVRSDIVPICDRCGNVVEYDDDYDRYWCSSCASFCLPLFQHALPLFYEMFAQWFSGVKKGGRGGVKIP